MKKREMMILAAALALAPGLLLAAVWDRLPERVVTTWGLNGAVTGTGTRLALVWPVGLELLLCALLLAAPYLDPKRENYRKFGRRYNGLCVAMTLFLSVINAAVIWENLRPGSIPVGRVVTGLLGLLFLWLGNIMPTFRHNYFVGVRTPWTLSDPAVWDRANRLGGRLFFLCGLDAGGRPPAAGIAPGGDGHPDGSGGGGGPLHHVPGLVEAKASQGP